MADSPDLLKRKKKTNCTKCPKCGEKVERRRRTLLMKLFFPFLKKYFCEKCLRVRYMRPVKLVGNKTTIDKNIQTPHSEIAA